MNIVPVHSIYVPGCELYNTIFLQVEHAKIESPCASVIQDTKKGV